MQRVPTRELELFIVRGFLDPVICAALIEQIDERRRPSEIADDVGIANFRTSETCDLDWRDPIVGDVDRKIAALLGFRSIRASRSRASATHRGRNSRRTPIRSSRAAMISMSTRLRPGQRTWTAMIYLNEPEDGGATRFKRIGKTIQPETGKLLAWNNLLPDGRPNPATIHQGMKVRRGTKYIITKWFRERSV